MSPETKPIVIKCPSLFFDSDWFRNHSPKMLGSLVAHRCSPPPISKESIVGDPARPRRGMVCCAFQRSHASIPKLEPFSRSYIERLMKDPPFMQKSENDLTEYCTTLEGDEAYNCWRAYFELKYLEKELPKENVESIIRQAGGVKTLIDCVHGITAMDKKAREVKKAQTTVTSNSEAKRHFNIPNGIPKTEEEIEEAEKARMPDSPFTRFLRSKGRRPA